MQLCGPDGTCLLPVSMVRRQAYTHSSRVPKHSDEISESISQQTVTGGSGPSLELIPVSSVAGQLGSETAESPFDGQYLAVMDQIAPAAKGITFCSDFCSHGSEVTTEITRPSTLER